MKFAIETVSKLTDIPAATLRNWEKRYGFPQPERSAGGHRLYTQRDVNFLKMVLRLQNEGRNLQELSGVYKSFRDDSAEETPKSPAPAEDDVSYRAKLIYESLLRYDVTATAQQWMILNAKLSPPQMFGLVFEELLRRVGDEWVRGRISIAQEHYLSSFLRMKLGAMLTLDYPASKTPSFALATLADERHEGGLMLVGCHLKFRGYPVHYFGVDMPFGSLEEAVHESRTGVVGLSYVDVTRLRRDYPELQRLECPVVLGGIAVMGLSDTEREELRQLNPRVSFCFEASSEKAADFLELVGRQLPKV